MGLFHPEELPWHRRALVGAPKTSSSIHGEFVDTAQPPHTPRGFLPTQHPEQPDPRHDAQAAYDPDAMPVQTVRNPCEGADDKRPADLTEWAARAIYGGAVLLGLAWWIGWL
jgi:hypothetical protein